MAHVHAISAACTFHGSVMDGEDDAHSVSKWYNFHPRLHAWPLFGDAEQVRYFRPNLTVIVEPSFNVIV